MRRYVCAAVAISAACVGRLAHPPYAPQSTEALEVVGYPPPPARVEFVPLQPTIGAVWIDGEWAWQGRRWAWRMGRWIDPPPGARFSPWALVRGDDGTTYYAPGVWRDAQGAAIAEPAALIAARPSMSDVVDPEGELETTGRSIRPGQDGARDAGGAAAPPKDVPAAGTGIDAGLDGAR